MKMHRFSFYRFNLFVFCFLMLGVSLAQAGPKVQKPSYLFVLSSKVGVLKTSGDVFTLTLNKVDPRVLWFTDRPQRKAGHLPVKQFIAQWSKGFKNNPPNAALVHADLSYFDGHKQAMTLELEDPSWNAKTGSLTFKLKNLSHRSNKSMTLKDVSLFVDPLQINEIGIRMRP